MINEKFKKVRDKFIDKGMIQEFDWLVLPPPPFDNSRLIGTVEENIRTYYKCIEKVYGEGWDYWNTWIDYQNYK